MTLGGTKRRDETVFRGQQPQPRSHEKGRRERKIEAASQAQNCSILNHQRSETHQQCPSLNPKISCHAFIQVSALAQPRFPIKGGRYFTSNNLFKTIVYNHIMLFPIRREKDTNLLQIRKKFRISKIDFLRDLSVEFVESSSHE